MAQLLGNVAVGSTVYLNENGISKPYLVVHQGLPSSMYDASCNGTWLLRQNIYANAPWDSSGNTVFTTASIITTYLPGLLSLYDSDIQSAIKTVKIPYSVRSGSPQVMSGSNGYSCKLFLLGGVETGFVVPPTDLFPNDGAKLSYFEAGTSSSAKNKRKATLNGDAVYWLLRSTNLSRSDWICMVSNSGDYAQGPSTYAGGVRPAMVMPTDLIVDDSNNITAIQVVPPSNITVPSIAMQQQTLPISWTPVSVSGADVTYQLQRNADNGGWTTIYTGADTSYTDTVSTWTQVQYQVATVALGITSDYTQSSIIPVSDPAVLVISGSDGNLGTLTSNLPYTVSSNTGNPISLTRTVNGAQVATITINSGFAYNIPITDLPTGANTVSISAQVQSSRGQVSKTRTWTYYKEPINIPDSGGVSQLVQNNQNVWPVTLAECIKVPTYFGNTLDKALELLAPAVNPTIMAAGTYTGTGQYGSSAPNILNFSTQPLLVLVYGPNISLSITTTNSSSPAYISGTQAKWYSTVSAEEQLNSSGVEYSYIAIVKTS